MRLLPDQMIERFLAARRSLSNAYRRYEAYVEALKSMNLTIRNNRRSDHARAGRLGPVAACTSRRTRGIRRLSQSGVACSMRLINSSERPAGSRI
jgi:hypothetical protein